MVQYRICIPNTDRWGSWSLRDKKGGSRPDAAIRFVQAKNEAVKDGLEQWRVMEVEGNPIANLLRFLMFGVGEVAPVTREVVRRAEPDRARRPHVHVG